MHKKREFFKSIVLGLWLLKVFAIIPDGQILVSKGEGDSYCAPASFGGKFSTKSSEMYYIFLPAIDSQGCNDIQVTNQSSQFILLMERGNCTFTDKASNAQKAGATGVIIYNSLKGLYGSLAYGTDKTDYECGNGEGWVSDVRQPYWSSENQPVECTQDPKCSSEKCILTNVTDSVLGTKACCAWDLYITMDATPEATEPINIPVAFITMADADVLLNNPELAQGNLQGEMFLRPQPYYTLTFFLLWSLAVFTVVVGAYQSSADIRSQLVLTPQVASPGTDLKHDGAQNFELEQGRSQELNLTVWDALGFIIAASGMLIILYYFDIVLVITVLYVVYSAGAIAAVIFEPAFTYIFGKFKDKVLCMCPESFGSALTVLDMACLTAGIGTAVWWFVVRDTASYAWVLQDIFGVCICVFFLSLIRVPNLKVATFLLVFAFFYDIFFVFITPLIFGRSVMMQVATGREPTADPTFCEKYPEDAGCKARDRIPMLLLMPQINDYHGGFALLGLGDIILPGLLVSFSLRLDYANRNSWAGGYFILMATGYAVGLFLAAVGVDLMRLGQPALMYLVPCTLGVFCARAYCKGQLREIWESPAFLNTPSPLGQTFANRSMFADNTGQHNLIRTGTSKEKHSEEDPLLPRS